MTEEVNRIALENFPKHLKSFVITKNLMKSDLKNLFNLEDCI